MLDVKQTTNTNSMIQNATQSPKSIPDAKQNKLSELINDSQVKAMFSNALADHADAFLASIVDLYANDSSLKICNANEVLMECFKAATLKLPINKQLGFCYILPYKDNRLGKMVPTFQLGYKGYIQLCMRTGAYRRIHAGPIYEGILAKENFLTGEITLSGEKSSNRAIGFVAFLETISGFSKALYWPMDRMVAHAKRFSKSYGSQSSPWTTNFDEMATKTILKSLLSRYGIMTIEMQTAFVADIGSAADEQLKEVPDEPLKDVPDAVAAVVAGEEAPAPDIA